MTDAGDAVGVRSRLKVGVDVPWVTGWSEETMDGVGPCASIGGRLALQQTERAGFGRPIYSMNHCRRQRETVARMLCPMCGAATDGEDRWTLTARRVRAGALRAKGLSPFLPAAMPDRQMLQNAGSIAPLHRSCAETAWSRCPHLGADPTLELARFADRWIVFPLLVDIEPAEPGRLLMTNPAAPQVAVAFLQILGVPDADKPARPPFRARRRGL